MTDMALPASAAAVALHAVRKAYGRQIVLPDFDFTLQRGESVALLGHNGAGKSTVFKLVLGLTRCEAGSIRYYATDGREVDGARWRRGVGYLPERVDFPGNLSGRETARFYARLKGRPRGEADALLERVGLGTTADAPLRTYSKGMRQRLGLAQALLGAPGTLLLDEPTSGLDPDLCRSFYALIGEHRAAGGTTLMASHALREVEQHASRFVFVDGGRVRAAGTLSELRLRAALPTAIRLVIGGDGLVGIIERVGRHVDWKRTDEHCAVLSCTARETPEVLHALTRLGPELHEVEVLPAGLDALYAHFVGGGSTT